MGTLSARLDAGVWASKQKGVSTLMAGTDGPELDPRLHYKQGNASFTRNMLPGCTSPA
jgi:hypothetical protein